MKKATRFDLSQFANPWYSVISAIRKYGAPHKREIIKALRSGATIPPECERDIHELLAGLIEGSKKLPRGKRPESFITKHLQNGYEQLLAKRVFRLKAYYGRRGIVDAYGEARAKVGRKYGIPENTLDAYCYPRNTRKPT
jgi:hypothetical protein